MIERILHLRLSMDLYPFHIVRHHLSNFAFETNAVVMKKQ